MTTKPGRVVTFNEGLPSILSHDPLITWSSDFDFSYIQFVGLECKCLFRHQNLVLHAVGYLENLIGDNKGFNMHLFPVVC